jgi:hypothetical protein
MREDLRMRLSARVVVSSLVAVGALVAAWPAFAGKPVAVDRDTTTQKLGYLVTQINLMRDSVPPQYRHQLGQARRKLEELSTAVGVAPPADAGGNYVVLDRESFIANVRWSMGIVASVRNDPACTQWSDALAPWGEDLVNFVNAAPFGRRRPAYAAPPPAPGYAPPPAAPGYAPPPAAPVYAPPPPRAPTVYVNPYAAPAPQPMDSGAFSQLVSTIGNESFDSSKLNVLRTATGNWFTCSQVAQLLGQFTFDDNKVKAVEIVASRIVDKNNAFSLYSSFTFSSSKERVRQILAR